MGDPNASRSLQRMLRQTRSAVDLEQLRDEYIDAFGGPRNLAMETKRIFDQAKGKSPMVQQKIILMIQQIVYATTIHGLGKPVDVSQLDDASLGQMLAEHLGRAPDVEIETETDEETRPSAIPPGA